MRSRLIFMLLLLFCSGCGTYQLSRKTAEKRLSRMITLYPDLIDTTTHIERDTVVRLDTIFTRSHRLDTIYNILLDSVFVVQDEKVRTEVRVINKERIKILTEVQADTILLRDTVFREVIKEVQVVPKYIKEDEVKRRKRLLWNLAMLVVLITAAILIYRYFFG